MPGRWRDSALTRLTPERLHRLYVEENLRDAEIAARAGCSRNRVTAIRAKYGIATRYSAERRDLPDMTPRQMDVMVGSLLGDGCIRRSRTDRESHYEEQHCTAQVEYLEWKAREFTSLRPFFTKRTLNAGGLMVRGIRHGVREMRLPASPELSALRAAWYPDGKKIVPADLQLTPLSIAVWYMDDGSYARPNYGDCATLCSFGFTEMENQRLVSLIEETTGARFRLIRTKPKGYAPRVGLRAYGESCRAFLRAVEPFIHPVMRYKLGRIASLPAIACEV